MRYNKETVLGLLRDSRDAGATDIHIKVPARPKFRVEDRLVQTPYPPVDPQDTMHIAQLVLGMARTELTLAKVTDHALSFGVQHVGRFRMHIYRQRGSICLTIHRMGLRTPRLKDLGAPRELSEQLWAQPGLILLTGQRRRLELLSAVLDSYNDRERGHLISIEQPMEYLHADRTAMVAQREVGVDVPDVTSGLIGAASTGADTIMCSDLPNAAAAEHALRIAESGRTVVASIAGCRWDEAGRWFLRMFPQHREQEMGERLGASLRMVVAELNDKVHVIPAAEVKLL